MSLLRKAFRVKVMARKKPRKIMLGGHLLLIFEADGIQIDENAPIYALADEDMVRDNSGKTSAVHFMRYQSQVDDVKMAVYHSGYACEPQALYDANRASLLAGLGSD